MIGVFVYVTIPPKNDIRKRKKRRGLPLETIPYFHRGAILVYLHREAAIYYTHPNTSTNAHDTIHISTTTTNNNNNDCNDTTTTTTDNDRN